MLSEVSFTTAASFRRDGKSGGIAFAEPGSAFNWTSLSTRVLDNILHP
jgi:hypothetical protein